MAAANVTNAELGLHPNAINLIGERFGKLLVTRFAGKRHRGYLVWECLCDCGKITEIDAGHLKRDRPTKSCGCLITSENLSVWATTHGMTETPEWLAWRNMIVRCTDTACESYRNYGGRGITVCQRWFVFEDFYVDVGARPSHRHSLDRHPDQNGNYEPGNVRWATVLEQANNRRSNIILTLHGESLTIAEWSRKLGIRVGTLYERVAAGWSPERTLEAKPASRSRRVPL